MSYDDGRVACTSDALVIRWYYFPFGSKRLRYSDISQVQRRQLTATRGKYRVWGSGDFVHWFNLDPGRPGKSVALVIRRSGRGIQPVITPDDPDGVLAELAAHGVAIATP